MENIEQFNVSSCVQCGTCTASCPLGGKTPSARTVVLKAINGQEFIDGIWACTTCYRCQDRCPRGVRVVDALLSLRAKTARNGEMPDGYRVAMENLWAEGHIVPQNEATRDRREAVGLTSPAPTTVYASEDMMGEVKRILKETGFNKLLGEEDER